jgi:glucose-fructose oxidoreductase
LQKKNQTRRSFIKSSSAILAVPFIIPSSVFGKNSVPPSDRVTLGHIGVGGRGGSLLHSHLQLSDSVSVAVCDTFKSKRDQRAQEVNDYYAKALNLPGYSGCAAYSDFRDVLARTDIDAVVIATPDHWHVPIAIEAVKAGKDVYVEKPLGVSIEENLALRETVNRYGAVFQYGTQQRSAWQFRNACELVLNGYIGRVHTMYSWCAAIDSQSPAFSAPGGSQKPIPVPEDFDYNTWLGPAAETPFTADRSTALGTYHHADNSLGFIAGWGAHPLDIAQWGNDTDSTAPTYYEGTGTIARGLFETVATWDFWCAYENGVNMRFMNQHKALPIVSKIFPQARDHGTLFIGTEGWVGVDRTNVYAEPVSLLNKKLRPDERHLIKSANHYQNYVNCIKTRQTPISPIASAVQSDIVSHLCDISIRVGRPINWDPKSEKIIGDVEAAHLTKRALRKPWKI